MCQSRTDQCHAVFPSQCRQRKRRLVASAQAQGKDFDASQSLHANELAKRTGFVIDRPNEIKAGQQMNVIARHWSIQAGAWHLNLSAN